MGVEMIDLIINGCNGTMGRTLITTISSNKDFQVVAGIDLFGAESSNLEIPTYKSLSDVKEKADILIDFSRAEGVIDLLKMAKIKKIPVVVATTGLTEDQLEFIEDCSSEIPVLQAANMSLGINLLRVLVKQSTAVLKNTFDIEIIEKHHNLKRDAPSGTALALAESVKSSIDRPMEYVYGRQEKNKQRESPEIGIHAIRGGNIVGEHDVIFAGTDERLTLSHAAYSKGLFAVGALEAAEYLHGKPPGLYHMDNVIAEKSMITNLYTSEEALITFRNIPAFLGTSQNIFKSFSDAGIIIDMISQIISDEGNNSLSFTVNNADAGKVNDLLGGLRRGNSDLDGFVIRDLCKITVEGLGIETQSSVATSIFAILAELEVEPKSMTTSETRISFIINKKYHDKVKKMVKERYNF
jgi:4-hydroxy-tetrahydrodipicolinate reductase